MKKKWYLNLGLFMMIIPMITNCQNSKEVTSKNNNKTIVNDMIENNETFEKATFAAGCFWCIEAAFDQLEGVVDVKSGYAGGDKVDPTYKEVTRGDTGHAEVIQVTYDPNVISYDTLLDGFFTVHDPTQLNRQGNDVGTQYRSEIFYHNQEQKEAAEKAINDLEASRYYNKPIVTKISSLDGNFYSAEGYHTDYYELNKSQPYCSSVIAPKLRKFNEKFQDKLKKD